MPTFMLIREANDWTLHTVKYAKNVVKISLQHKNKIERNAKSCFLRHENLTDARSRSILQFRSLRQFRSIRYQFGRPSWGRDGPRARRRCRSRCAWQNARLKFNKLCKINELLVLIAHDQRLFVLYTRRKIATIHNKKPRAFDKNLVLAYDIRLIRDLEWKRSFKNVWRLFNIFIFSVSLWQERNFFNPIFE